MASVLARLRGSVPLRLVLIFLRCCSTVRWKAVVGIAVAVIGLSLLPPAARSVFPGPFGSRGF